MQFDLPQLFGRPPGDIPARVETQIVLLPTHESGFDGDFEVVAQFQIDLFIDRDVFHGAAADQRVESVIGDKAERLHAAIGQRFVPQFALLVVLETIKTDDPIAPSLALELVITRNGDIEGRERRQAFRPAIRNRVATLDAVEEVLRQSLLDDLLGLVTSDAAAAHHGAIERAVNVFPHLPFRVNVGEKRRRGRRFLMRPLSASELRDVFNQPNHANDQAHLSIFIIFTARVIHAHVTGQVHRFFCFVRFGGVIRAPTDPAGEVTNLYFHFAGELAIEAPLQCVGDARRETHVEHFNFIGVSQRAKFDGRGIDQGIGPGEFETVVSFAESKRPGLFNEGEIDGVINSELNGVAPGQGDDIDPGVSWHWR